MLPLSPTTTDLPSPQQESQADEALKPNYADFKFAQPRLKHIINDWEAIKSETTRLRSLRYIRVDKNYLQSEGKLKADETYVATRLIDSNIRTEQPQFISYLTQSRRAAVFTPKTSKPLTGVENLEENFTKVARYLSWESQFIKCVDGTQTHGWDSVEIVFDPEQPGHFSIEHVGHDNLLFDRQTEDLQVQELILRRVKYTALQLRANIRKFGFDQEQVLKLIGTNKDNDQGIKDVKYDIFKCFYRDETGVIWVGWFHPDCDNWLKAPEKLFLGIRNTKSPPIEPIAGSPNQLDYPKLDELEYPFYIFGYYESENETIAELKGRAYLDEPSQEAASAILSGIVNGTTRAAQPYASLAPQNPNPNPNSDPPKQLDFQLLPGRIYDKPINFFTTPFPPVSSIQAFQTVTATNRAETSKPDFAVENRKDSRKTATEVASAKETSNALTGVQVVQLSTFVRKVYNRCWKIYQARVLQGNITIDNPELLLLFQQEYEIFSSGDVDVLQRADKLQKQLQAWDVIQKTPISQIFLEDLLRNMFPEEASKYIQALQQGDGRQLVMRLATILQAVVINPQTHTIEAWARPYAQQLQQLSGEVQAFLSAGGGSQAEQAGGMGQEVNDKIEPLPPHDPNEQPQMQGA